MEEKRAPLQQFISRQLLCKLVVIGTKKHKKIKSNISRKTNKKCALLGLGFFILSDHE